MISYRRVLVCLCRVRAWALRAPLMFGRRRPAGRVTRASLVRMLSRIAVEMVTLAMRRRMCRPMRYRRKRARGSCSPPIFCSAESPPPAPANTRKGRALMREEVSKERIFSYGFGNFVFIVVEKSFSLNRAN